MEFEKIHNKGQARLFKNDFLEMLTKTHVPQNEEQRKRLLNAEFMHSFIVAEENFLDSNSLKNMWTEKTGKSAKGMWRDRLSVAEMFACFFPDDFDIRLD